MLFPAPSPEHVTTRLDYELRTSATSAVPCLLGPRNIKFSEDKQCSGSSALKLFSKFEGGRKMTRVPKRALGAFRMLHSVGAKLVAGVRQSLLAWKRKTRFFRKWKAPCRHVKSREDSHYCQRYRGREDSSCNTDKLYMRVACQLTNFQICFAEEIDRRGTYD